MSREIGIARLLTCSPQCDDFPGSNHVDGTTFRRFLSTSSSSNSQNWLEAELELDSPSRISSINVGNSGSAFIEVLAKESEGGPHFVSVLCTKSLMSPIDSKSGKRRNEVKTFGSDVLNKSVLRRKWRIVLIKCRQPYVTSSSFGLSFIRFYTDDRIGKPSSEPLSPPSPLDLNGSFTSPEEMSRSRFRRSRLGPLKGRKLLPSAERQKSTGRVGPRKRKSFSHRNDDEGDSDDDEMYLRARRKEQQSSMAKREKGNWLKTKAEMIENESQIRRLPDFFVTEYNGEESEKKCRPHDLLSVGEVIEIDDELRSCPLCQVKFSADILMTHASFCQGNDIIELS